MKARYEGFCKRCRQSISVGDAIVKDSKFGYVHDGCTEATGESPAPGKSPAPRSPIKARYAGTCKRCRRPIDVGDDITKDDKFGYVHAECPAASSDSPAPRQSAPRKRTNRRPGYCDRCGIPLAAGEGHLYRCMGEASGCMRHYDDEGWHVDCLDVDACKARREERTKKRRFIAEFKKAFAARRKELTDEFLAGTYPDPEDGQVQLDGEEIALDDGRSRLYGGGQWYVIDKASGRIWHVHNNGGDGDSWDRNNVRTGGAGALGWYLPHTEELEKRVRAVSHETLVEALAALEGVEA